MSHEMEAAGLASAGGLSTGDAHPVQSGRPCANCGALVEERFCTRCGQLASDFHRPIWELVSASLADTFSLDGRLVRSMPMLVFRPGRMTRNYLDGKRARYVPPFRMFLLASVIFFLALFSMGDQLGWYDDMRFNPNFDEHGTLVVPEEGGGVSLADPVNIEEIETELAREDLSEEEREKLIARRDFYARGIPVSDLLDSAGKVDREKLREFVDQQVSETASEAERQAFWRTTEHAVAVFENQDRFGARIREWAPRFSLLFLPIMALTFTFLFAWHRSKYVYDHLISALHLQTFFYILATVAMVLCAIFTGALGWIIGIALLLLPVYIFSHIRVAYGSGLFMSLMRTFCFLILGIVTLASLFAGLILASFALV